MSSEIKNCQNCKNQFTIEPEDFDFYKKIDVPPPTWCPYCRTTRRLTWRNERTFYKRTCSLCGKNIIAMYSAEAPFPVYCRECWFSDKWDPLSYGREYDFSKNFFEQLINLFNVVPQIALQVTSSVNSEFINQAANCKNCYLITSATEVEDSLYSNRILYSRNILESQAVNKVENSYEAKESRESSNLIYSTECYSCFDMAFCYDARNCNSCFMSANLRGRSYLWYGDQITAEVFKEKLEEVNLGSYENLKKLTDEFEDLKAKKLTKFSQQKNTANCTGNVITNAKNSRHSFYVSEVEDTHNLLFVDNAKDTYDMNNGCCTMERMYEVNTGGINCANVYFSSDTWPEVRDTTYSISCRNGVHDLFGCVGVQKKAYCILNKEYSPEEYRKLVKRIIDQMKEMPYTDQRGRVYGYGEFFPPELSPFAFNESAAYTYTSLTKKEVLELGWAWKESEKRSHIPTLSAHNLPDSIREVTESISEELIQCEHKGSCEEQCTEVFRIIPSEYSFYQKKNIALPRLCPNCRHYNRVKKMPSLRLYERNCMCDNERYNNKTSHPHHTSEPCLNTFETSYAPDRPEIIYCEQCYSAEIV